ncbi:trypsin-like serine peptidase [Devosia insulae]|uniref:trypsin-like serine peptidase n=1 Tax=Devosia insulae TaxID=408174 RepID=UPI00159F2F5B|nr:serine protease [Devosia insulae]
MTDPSRTWATMAPRVCRIEAPRGTSLGTGFLVGPDLVMTNQHVIDQIDDPTQAVFRFDFQVDDNQRINISREYYLADKGWRLAQSPASELDYKSDPLLDPGLSHLDYALVRISADAAYDQVGGSANAPRLRGWINMPPPDVEPRNGGALTLLGHPVGAPLREERSSQSIVSMTPSGARLRHRTRSFPGSSGSPCFDEHWTLIAVHHAGDPAKEPTYNSAIPAKAIVADLVAKAVSLPVYVSQEWPLTIALPNRIDFRGRADPGATNWTKDALMVSLLPLAVSASRPANQRITLKRSSLRLPQLPHGSAFHWGWFVDLADFGDGWLGHVAAVIPTPISHQDSLVRETMYRPQSERDFMSWAGFVDFVRQMPDRKLLVEITHEFDVGIVRDTYEIATDSVRELFAIGDKNELSFVRFIQPDVIGRAGDFDRSSR